MYGPRKLDRSEETGQELGPAGGHQMDAYRTKRDSRRTDDASPFCKITCDASGGDSASKKRAYNLPECSRRPLIALGVAFAPSPCQHGACVRFIFEKSLITQAEQRGPPFALTSAPGPSEDNSRCLEFAKSPAYDFALQDSAHRTRAGPHMPRPFFHLGSSLCRCPGGH